ncbi:hypothetical protein C4K34_3754 [Pseudomonas chlororaphis subsp. piscium]|nr:hypothetical protein C4K34_3754 [Pseudomonas chlororaphis subsp. piscium]AZC64149.1 hypothetical protein C4K33_3659 [Pseudomonas chlororaphis subsp. piscium]AZC70372.1 hypothetical protein C4K32_3712 [Pseudomonas chlororaphis subsp. piscium]AZC76639.1 hypothetical protein C4K31_3738 [Pseudomonas chlororaphis subsp. piscium]AZC90061.1 hypothetical protein C4K29_3762 [Pseudomonas chlororaphis subsp. piscium]
MWWRTLESPSLLSTLKSCSIDFIASIRRDEKEAQATPG